MCSKQHRLFVINITALWCFYSYTLKCFQINVSNSVLPQLVITAFITMTVFLRTQLEIDLEHANYLMGSLYYAIVRLMTNGVAELTLTIIRLPVVYRQRSFYLYPAWAYSVPASILKIPISLCESLLWTAITYYVIGYTPEVER